MAKASFFVAGKPDECWIWLRSTIKGYGSICVNGKTQLAHRVAYKEAFGEIPEGAFICHTCDTPLCVNPAHLYAGDAKTNQRDAVERRRHRNSRKTTCKRGHPLSGSNLYVWSNGFRQCRICKALRQRERRAGLR